MSGSSFLRALLSKASCGLLPAAWLYARSGYFRPLPSTFEPSRVAIISCNYIGDNFWAAQVLPALWERWPHAVFTIFTKPASLPIWRGIGVPAEIIAVPEVISDRRREPCRLYALLRRARENAARDFDLVIDLTGNRYSALFTFFLRPRFSLGSDRFDNELRVLYSQRADARCYGSEHLALLPWRTVHPLVRYLPPELYVPVCPRAGGDTSALRGRLGIASGARLAMLAPSAGWADKEWPESSFVSVGRRLLAQGFTVLLVDAPAQRARCERIAAQLPAPPGVEAGVRIVCEPDIAAALALLTPQTLFLGNDSGLGHLAAAAGSRTVTVYTGSTDPALTRPLGPRALALTPVAGEPPSPELALTALLGE